MVMAKWDCAHLIKNIKLLYYIKLIKLIKLRLDSISMIYLTRDEEWTLVSFDMIVFAL